MGFRISTAPTAVLFLATAGLHSAALAAGNAESPSSPAAVSEGATAPSDPKGAGAQDSALAPKTADETKDAGAATASAGQKDEKGVTPSAKRRSGVALAALFGGGISSMSGYPNDVSKLGDASKYASGGVLVGGSFGFALMGALSDQINVGFFGNFGSFSSSDYKSTTAAGGVRFEAFPFAGRAHWQDLGFALSTGVGMAELARADGVGEGAAVSQSFIGAGAFYELRFANLLGGHAVFAPGIQSEFTFGRSADAVALLLGGRLAFYGGP